MYRSGGFQGLFSFLVAFAFGCGSLFWGRGRDRTAGKSKLSAISAPRMQSVTSFLLMQDNLIVSFKNWNRNRLLETNAGKREARETSAEVRLDSYHRN